MAPRSFAWLRCARLRWVGLVILISVAAACHGMPGAPHPQASPPSTPTARAQATAPTLPTPAYTPCPKPFDSTRFGVRPFPADRQPPSGLVPTNYAVLRATSGKVYAIYAGSRVDDPKRGMLVLEELATDPCAIDAGYPPPPPTYFAYPRWPGPLTITKTRTYGVTADTGASWGIEAPLFEVHSGRAEQGIAYSFVLPTHCGLDYTVDFDGSVWGLDDSAWAGDPAIGSRIGFNQQEGTMTLLDADHALFKFDSGAFRGEIRFTRIQGAKLLPGGCA